MLALRAILHPTDFSAHSRPALELACALARDHGGRLVLLHVHPPEIVYGEMAPIIEEPAAVRAALKEELDLWRPTDRSVPTDCVLKEGNPATTIVETAKELHADLIVMGTHGRSGVGRLLLGSVAEVVLRKAPCPVLTVKVPLTKVMA